MQSRKEKSNGVATDCVIVDELDSVRVHRLDPGVAEQCFPRSCQITTIDDLLLYPTGKSPRGQCRAALPLVSPDGGASKPRDEPARHLLLVQGGQGRSAGSAVVSAFVVTGAVVGAMLLVAWEVAW